ncbi:MAG: glycosyltransferase family 9 protein [Phormidesmis sp. CAN_BIN36]|nr:glycosyltransferase family 9 protein [Phormidesmis sp. CAN_BIN36]
MPCPDVVTNQIGMNRILFVELLGGIGDVLIALPAIQALGRSHPNASLTVLTFLPGGDLLKADPLINHVEIAQKGQAKQAIETLITQQKYDLIVSDTNYDNIDQTIHLSDADRVVTNLWRSPPDDEFVSDHFLKILLSEGLICTDAIAAPQLHITQEEQQNAHKKLGGIKSPIVVLYPDSGMQIKQWSIENFVRLGQELQKELNASIVVPIGSDANQVTELVQQIGGTAQIWQPGTLRELAAMLSQADLTIASDTGSARISAAVGTQTVTLFGPSWQGRYGQPAPHINIQGYPECPERVIQNFTTQHCWYSGVCPFEQWNTCLDEISVDRVMAICVSLLKAQSQQWIQSV